MTRLPKRSWWPAAGVHLSLADLIFLGAAALAAAITWLRTALRVEPALFFIGLVFQYLLPAWPKTPRSDPRLAEVDGARAWTQDRARDWWVTHLGMRRS